MEDAYKKQIVEGLVFASDTPISEQKIAALVEEITPAQVRKVVGQLNEEYTKSKRSFQIARVASGFQIKTRKDLSPWVKKLFKGRIRARLSQAGLESLAIIVFKQPIGRVDIDAIRGVNSGGVIKTLLERNLVSIAGRSAGPGKPILYGTTKEFLNYLGVDEIKDLPKPKEIEEIMGKLDSSEAVADNILDALTAGDELEAEVEVVETEPDNSATSLDDHNDGNGKTE